MAGFALRHRKTLHSAKHSKSIKNPKTHSVGVPPVQLPFAKQPPDDGIGAKPSGPPIFDDRRETMG